MYSHHEVEVTSSGVAGAPRVHNAPMVLPFQALYNRPGLAEGDLVLRDQDFKDIYVTTAQLYDINITWLLKFPNIFPRRAF
ncbi:hypothetical protein ACN38_g13118 [Penicillium nordicum]|uniref:Uncharacterized protein n=1 Tax=Penicillium nordicum TaxID=229535 RepID=A0A0M8NXG6_9EURO|nr:hypothetical protein ACN38_g13118 [Penicillium nordicum]